MIMTKKKTTLLLIERKLEQQLTCRYYNHAENFVVEAICVLNLIFNRTTIRNVAQDSTSTTTSSNPLRVISEKLNSVLVS